MMGDSYDSSANQIALVYLYTILLCNKRSVLVPQMKNSQ